MKRAIPKRTTEEKRKDAFYVYCLGEASAFADLIIEGMPEAIEPASSVELVAEGRLAAVVSRVPRAEYSGEAIEAQLGDPAWTAVRAMRHQSVVEYFAASATAIPLRFGTIYLSRAGVQRMLSERGAELRSLIRRLRGREEWSVSVIRNRATMLAGIESASPRLKTLSQSAATASPGRSYLLKKKLEASKSKEAEIEAKRAVTRIERALKAVSDNAARLQVPKGVATDKGETVAKLAFLVRSNRFSEFVKAAEQVAREYVQLGLRLELAGPMPAYTFTATKE